MDDNVWGNAWAAPSSSDPPPVPRATGTSSATPDWSSPHRALHDDSEADLSMPAWSPTAAVAWDASTELQGSIWSGPERTAAASTPSWTAGGFAGITLGKGSENEEDGVEDDVLEDMEDTHASSDPPTPSVVEDAWSPPPVAAVTSTLEDAWVSSAVPEMAAVPDAWSPTPDSSALSTALPTSPFATDERTDEQEAKDDGEEDAEHDAWVAGTPHVPDPDADAGPDAWGASWDTAAPAGEHVSSSHSGEAPLDEWERARMEKEKRDRRIPPDLLQAILDQCTELCEKLWPGEYVTADDSDAGSISADFSSIPQFDHLISVILPTPLAPLAPPLKIGQTATFRAQLNALKATRYSPLARRSPLSHLAHANPAWEVALRSSGKGKEDADADVPTGWRIVEKKEEKEGEKKEEGEKRRGGLLSFWGRRKTASTVEGEAKAPPSPTRSESEKGSIASKANSPTASPRPSIAGSRPGSSIDIPMSIPGRSSTPVAVSSPLTNVASPPLSSAPPLEEKPRAPDFFTDPPAEASSASPSGPAPAAAPSAVSRFLGRFSRSSASSSSSSPRNSIALSADDLDVLQDIVPSWSDKDGDDDEPLALRALTGMIESKPVPLPKPLAPPPGSGLGVAKPGKPQVPMLPPPLAPTPAVSSRPQTPVVSPLSATASSSSRAQTPILAPPPNALPTSFMSPPASGSSATPTPGTASLFDDFDDFTDFHSPPPPPSHSSGQNPPVATSTASFPSFSSSAFDDFADFASAPAPSSSSSSSLHPLPTLPSSSYSSGSFADSSSTSALVPGAGSHPGIGPAPHAARPPVASADLDGFDDFDDFVSSPGARTPTTADATPTVPPPSSWQSHGSLNGERAGPGGRRATVVALPSEIVNSEREMHIRRQSETQARASASPSPPPWGRPSMPAGSAPSRISRKVEPAAARTTTILSPPLANSSNSSIPRILSPPPGNASRSSTPGILPPPPGRSSTPGILPPPPGSSARLHSQRISVMNLLDDEPLVSASNVTPLPSQNASSVTSAFDLFDLPSSGPLGSTRGVPPKDSPPPPLTPPSHSPPLRPISNSPHGRAPPALSPHARRPSRAVNHARAASLVETAAAHAGRWPRLPDTPATPTSPTAPALPPPPGASGSLLALSQSAASGLNGLGTGSGPGGMSGSQSMPAGVGGTVDFFEDAWADPTAPLPSAPEQHQRQHQQVQPIPKMVTPALARKADHVPMLNLLQDSRAKTGQRWPAPPSPLPGVLAPPPGFNPAAAQAQQDEGDLLGDGTANGSDGVDAGKTPRATSPPMAAGFPALGPPPGFKSPPLGSAALSMAASPPSGPGTAAFGLFTSPSGPSLGAPSLVLPAKANGTPATSDKGGGGLSAQDLSFFEGL